MGFLGKLFNKAQSNLACNFCSTPTPPSSFLENSAGSALLQPWDIHVSMKVACSGIQNIKLGAQVCDGITHSRTAFLWAYVVNCHVFLFIVKHCQN